MNTDDETYQRYCDYARMIGIEPLPRAIWELRRSRTFTPEPAADFPPNWNQ